MCDSTSDVRAHEPYDAAVPTACDAVVAALTPEARNAWLAALVSHVVWDVSMPAPACAVEAARAYLGGANAEARATAIGDAATALLSLIPNRQDGDGAAILRLAVAAARGERVDVRPF